MEHLVKDSLSNEEIVSIVHGSGTTEEKVLLFKHTVPGVSTREIAMQLGISDEWARRLIQRNNPNYVADNSCPECHKPLEKEPKIRKMCRECYSKKANIQIQCAGCGEWISRPRPVYNRSQKSDRYRGNMYCSRECFDKNKLPYRRERVSYNHTCQKCSKVTTVYGANEKRKAKMRKFCSNCYGVKTTELIKHYEKNAETTYLSKNETFEVTEVTTVQKQLQSIAYVNSTNE